MSYYPRKRAFSTVSYSRDDEFKYADLYTNLTMQFQAGGGPTFEVPKGWSSFISDSSPNLIRHVRQGTTATTRIGDVIDSSSLDINVLLSANMVKTAPSSQGGEASAEPGIEVADVFQFIRTTFRLLLVLDTQSNSTATTISYSDVMGFSPSDNDQQSTPDGSDKPIPALAHPEIQNLGRFKILKDFTVDLDAVNPQRFLNLSHYCGKIRYNGPTQNALTDKGYYLLISSSSSTIPVSFSPTSPPNGVSPPDVLCPTPQICSRLKFSG